MILVIRARQYIFYFYILSERNFYSLLIIFFIELVLVSSKVTARVAVNIIIIVVLRDFIINGFLYIGGEVSIVHKRAEI